MADGVIIFRPAGAVVDDEEEALATESDPELQRLEAEIAAKRERVVASFGELRRQVEVATDWRAWVRAHPLAWIAGAVSIGFVIGSVTSGGRSSSR